MKHQVWPSILKDLGLGSVLQKVDSLLEAGEAFRSCRVKAKRDQQVLGVA